MNIAHLLPYSVQYPLTTHNGRYEWVLRLATAQVNLGHTVTIYCGPSTLAVSKLQFQTLVQSLQTRLVNNRALFTLALQNPKHDIFHSHFDSLHYALANQTSKPVIYTQHWFPNAAISAAANAQPTNILAVPVTDYMADQDHQLQIPTTKVITHGIDLSLFATNYGAHTGALLYVGRMSPQKGILQAIKLARQSNEKLDIVGKISSKDPRYWQDLQPFIDGEQIRYLGSKSTAEVAKLLAQTKALLFLPQSHEAFGQTFIEAQACGTPVITNPIGAANGLFDPGKTGFTIADNSSLAAISDQLSTVNPEDCRTFSQAFNQAKMVTAYDRLYNTMI